MVLKIVSVGRLSAAPVAKKLAPQRLHYNIYILVQNEILPLGAVAEHVHNRSAKVRYASKEAHIRTEMFALFYNM